MRLIDADALKARIIEDVPGFLDGGSSITKAFIIAMLATRNATPTIDAVQIVRCKDCKKHDTYDCHITYLTTQKTPNDWFCADGRKKDDNG